MVRPWLHPLFLLAAILLAVPRAAPATSCLSIASHEIEVISHAEAIASHEIEVVVEPQLVKAAPLSAAEEARVLKRLGLAPENVAIRVFNERGGMNTIYVLESRDQRKIRFSRSDQLPPEVRGRPVDWYVLKLAKGQSTPEIIHRDALMLEAIKRVLRENPEFDGIRLTEPHVIKGMPGQPRLMVQKKSRGRNIYSVLKPHLHSILPEEEGGAYSPAMAKRLFAHALEAELAGKPLDEIFSPANLTTPEGLPLYRSEAAIAQFRKLWTDDPTLFRIRSLMRKLYRLSRRPELNEANKVMGHNRLRNVMPWSTGRDLLPSLPGMEGKMPGRPKNRQEALNGDFGSANFFLVEDDRVLMLELIDF